jgi:3-phenylpropionate/cinnamic acid dioxygenase small subunit
MIAIIVVATMSGIPSLEELADRRAIEDLLVRYARALDSRDWPLLGQVFLPHSVAIYDGIRNDGLDAIVDICRLSLEPLTASQHFLGNVAVDLDGDRATSSCYLHAQHYRAGARGLSTYVMAGTYRDRLVRTADGWRIEHRELEITWTDGNAALVTHS